MLLSNRVAIITGGAKGIGRGIALKFADEGCAVAIADINTEEADEVVSSISRKDGKALALHCDVTDGKQVQETINKVIDIVRLG